MNPINAEVKVHSFFVLNKQVYVVRDDLCCPFPGNNNSKSRGIYQFLRSVDSDVVGVLDTCVSRAGWGTAWIASALGKDVYLYVPSRCQDDFFRRMARLHGATIVPLRGNLTQINYNVARKHVTSLGGVMLPIYLRLHETVDEIYRVASAVLREYDVRSVVISVGSGTIASGLVKATEGKVKVYGVGHRNTSVEERLRFIERMSGRRGVITIIKYEYTYGQENYNTTPFPCDIYYDKWAWQWMVENISRLEDPILFWNVGGEWHHETGMDPLFRGDGISSREEVIKWIESRTNVQ